MTHTRAVHRAARAARTTPLVHAIPYDAAGHRYARAVCGASVADRRDHIGRPVTCPDCLTEERRYARLDLGQSDTKEPIMSDPSQPSAQPTDDEDPIPLDATFERELPNTDRTLDEMFGADAGGPESFSLDRNTAHRALGLPITLAPAPAMAITLHEPDRAFTSVMFPVLVAGMATISVDALEEPGRRVAEILEALEPVLTPPSAVAGVTALVARANAHVTTSTATFDQANELYELICQNEKGLEAALDHIVAFFYRPWKTMTGLRASLAKPLAEAKARLSRDAGEWKRLDDARVERERRAAEAAAAAEERARLELAARQERERAAAAEQAGRIAEADQADQNAEELKTAAAEVVPPSLPAANFAPASHRPAGPSGGGTRSKDSWECVITDELAIYKAIAAGTVSKAAAPLDLAYLKRRANDDKDDLKNLIPGCEARKVGGLASKGKR